MCNRSLLCLLYIGITWRDLKTTDVWLLPAEILTQLIWDAAWARECFKALQFIRIHSQG